MIARTSVMGYKGTRKRVAEMGANWALTTSSKAALAWGAGRVRIAVQVIGSPTKPTLGRKATSGPWTISCARSVGSETRWRRLSRLKLAPVGFPFRLGEIRKHHDFYLRARHLWNQRTPPSFRGHRLFQEKLFLIYPNYAPAWAGPVPSHAILPITSDRRRRECFTRAREAAEKALTLDDNLPEALTAYGIVHFWFDWGWDSAGGSFAVLSS